MKRRYAGISKTFYNGYLELHDNDFFEVEGKDISDFNLADKINLYFKIGNYVDIDFTLEESLHLERVKRCETFEDVLNVAEDLYKYCKGEMEEDIKEQIAEVEAEEEQDGMDMEGSGRPDLGEDDSEYDDEEGDSKSEIDMDYQKTQPDQLTIEELHQQLEHAEPKVETVDSLAKGIESLIDQGGVENFYIEIPKINLDKVIISNKAIHKICAENWEGYMDRKPFRYDVTEEELENMTVFSEVDLEYKKFKKSAQKNKKSSQQYSQDVKPMILRELVLRTAKHI